MPSLLRAASSSPSASEGDTPGTSVGSSVNGDVTSDYPAVTFPDYAEKPLDEQLEPIAVIGMGKLNQFAK